jgi:curli production assembly/transport component CsgG
MEGVDLGLWDFASKDAGWPYLWRYRQERDGNFTPQQVQAAMDASRAAPPMKVKPREVPMRETAPAAPTIDSARRENKGGATAEGH